MGRAGVLVSASAWSSCASGGPSLTPAPGHLLEGGASCSISGLFQTRALQCFFLAQLGFKSELELEVCGGYRLQGAPACEDWQCHPHERAWRVRRSQQTEAPYLSGAALEGGRHLSWCKGARGYQRGSKDG